jgi:hypothetical protein
MVDTWAATTAGAMSLTENGLYTLEAWRTFWSRLAPGGVIGFSRWYGERDQGQTMRLVSLAWATLLSEGVAAPQDHIAVLASPPVATVLVSNLRLTPRDRSYLDDCVNDLKFQPLLLPGRAPEDPILQRIVEARSLTDLARLRAGGLDCSPPFDRSPFFFNAIRLAELPEALGKSPIMEGNLRALVVVLAFICAAAVLAIATIRLPVAREARIRRQPGLFRGAIHFSLLGAVFMLVEMGAMQRLSLLLGHPAYSLVLVLGTLLVAGSLGSLASEQVPLRAPWQRGPTALAALAVVAYAYAAEAAVPRGMAFSFLGRVGLSVLLLAPLGLVLGACLPVALRSMQAGGKEAAPPWMWAANGAASVLGTFAAVLLSMETSIVTSVCVGAAAYALTSLALPALGRSASTAVPAEAGASPDA